MTKEEAIRNIDALNAVCGQKDFFDKEFEEALLVAEKALEQQPCEDAVSRKAVINYLYKNMTWYDKNGSIADDDVKLKDITDLVNGLPSVQPKSSWISVKDKLPKDHEEVWITDVEGNVERARFYKEPYPEDGEKDMFACRTYLVYVENVLAWQPILKPEPYKEGE